MKLLVINCEYLSSANIIGLFSVWDIPTVSNSQEGQVKFVFWGQPGKVMNVENVY